MQEIPFWERYMLTIREAAEYFHIGEKKMRQLVEEYEDADFVITNGNRVDDLYRIVEGYPIGTRFISAAKKRSV